MMSRIGCWAFYLLLVLCLCLTVLCGYFIKTRHMRCFNLLILLSLLCCSCAPIYYHVQVKDQAGAVIEEWSFETRGIGAGDIVYDVTQEWDAEGNELKRHIRFERRIMEGISNVAGMLSDMIGAASNKL